MGSIRQAVAAVREKYGTRGLCVLRALLEVTKKYRRAEYPVVEALIKELCPEYKQESYDFSGLIPWIRRTVNSVVGRIIIGYTAHKWHVCREGWDRDCLDELERAINEAMQTLRKDALSRNAFSFTEADSNVGQSEVTRREIVDMLVEIGRELGFDARKEYSEDGIYRHDVVWFRPPARIPLKVFEMVSGKNDVDKALSRLKHAYNVWRGSDLHIVLIDEAKKEHVDALIGTYLSGAFHELAGKLIILYVEDVKKLYDSKDAIKKLKLSS